MAISPKFNLETKFPDKTTQPQQYGFHSKNDTIAIGDFLISKQAGKWYCVFDTSKSNMSDILDELVLPSEVSSDIAIIPLKKVTMTTTGNIEFELESTTGRKTGKTKLFTITPNSLKFKGKEIPVADHGTVMPVLLPKNFMELFMTKNPVCSLKGNLPQEFFEAITQNKTDPNIRGAFDSGLAEHIQINNADKSKSIDILRVGDKKYTLFDGKISEINSIFHMKQSDGKETLGITFKTSKGIVARVLKDVTPDNGFALAEIWLDKSLTHAKKQALWNDPSEHLYDSTTLATKNLTTTEFKARKTRQKNLTSNGRPLPPPILIEQKSGHWFINGVDTGYEYQGKNSTLPSINGSRNWDINGVDTGIRAQASDGRTAVTPELNSSSGNLVIGSYDAGVNLDGEVPPIPYVDATSKTWIINGIDSGLSQTTKLTIKNNEWREDDGSADGKEITALTNKSSIGKDGPQISIDATSKNWTVDGVDTGEPAEVKELASKIEQDPSTGQWKIDGVLTGASFQGKKGNDAKLPRIDSSRHWEINGKKTNILGMTKDKKDHGILPEIDPSNGNWKFDDYVHTKGLKGEPGEIAKAPSFDPSSGHWIINGQDTGLDAYSQKLTIKNNEWREDDGSADGKEITALTNKSSIGKDGKDGISPEIGKNGNWFIEGNDTGKLAEVKEKTNEDKKDKDDNTKPFVFPGTPFFRVLGLVAGVLGILSGLLPILALGIFLFAVPNITKNMVNDYRASQKQKQKQKTNLLEKTLQKQKQKAIIKQRRKDLRCSHNQMKNFAKGLTLSPDWQAATDPLFSKNPTMLKSKARKALKKLDYSRIPLQKIEHHEDQLQSVLDYVDKLEPRISSGEITSDPKKQAEMLTLIGDIKTEVGSAQTNINTIKEIHNFIMATQKEASNPAYNFTPERLYAGLSSAGVTHDMVENLDSDPNKVTQINNAIEKCYTGSYVSSMKNTLKSGGILDGLVSSLDSKLDEVGKSSERLDHTPDFHA